MNFVPPSSLVVALSWLLVFVAVAAFDLLSIAQRREAARLFPGGPTRLAWAVGLYAAGRSTLFILTLLLPMSVLLAASAAASLPEIVGYLIIFVIAGAGSIVGLRLGAAIEKRLASPLLTDRAALLASPVANKTGAR